MRRPAAVRAERDAMPGAGDRRQLDDDQRPGRESVMCRLASLLHVVSFHRQQSIPELHLIRRHRTRLGRHLSGAAKSSRAIRYIRHLDNLKTNTILTNGVK